MINRSASGVIDLLRGIYAIRKRWEGASDDEVEIWFRGVGSCKYTLIPGAYRKPELDEESMGNEFEQRSPSYFDREPTDEWDWYFLMQHYRLPTRLLDWSESPLVALFFALDSWKQDRATTRARRLPGPCVWMLEPGSLNLISTDNVDNAPIVPPGKFSNHWLLRQCGYGKPVATFEFEGKTYTNALPLAIMPKRREPRILAQQGMFTVHGASRDALESVVASDRRGRIACIRLEKPASPGWRDDLRTLGVFRAALFPEPDSIALDLRDRYEA